MYYLQNLYLFSDILILLSLTCNDILTVDFSTLTLMLLETNFLLTK